MVKFVFLSVASVLGSAFLAKYLAVRMGLSVLAVLPLSLLIVAGGIWFIVEMIK